MGQFSSGGFESGADELGGVEGFQLKRQVQRGDFSGMRRLLSETRENKDWQDRLFMLDVVAPSVALPAVKAALDAEPSAPDLMLLRMALLANLVREQRGTRVSDETTDAQFISAAQWLEYTLDCLAPLTKATPDDPTPLLLAIQGMVIFEDYHDAIRQAFQKITQIAPDFAPAYRVMVTAASERWGGSHEESLAVARMAVRRARPGSDLYSGLFLAHTMVYSHLLVLEDNEQGAYNYRNMPSVTRELNSAFDQWVSEAYRPSRSSIKYMHDAACWFLHAEDNARLKIALGHTQNVKSRYPWATLGHPDELLAEARQIAASTKKGGWFGWFRV